MINPKINYLLHSIHHVFDQAICPFCNGTEVETLRRKYVVTRLVKCQNCKLLFRVPADRSDFNEKFYQDTYSQDDHITTQLPSSEELEKLISNNFKDTGKEAGRVISLLNVLLGETKNLKILDYGASWGYMSYQMKNHGMIVQSFEISKPRATYGNQKLGLQIQTRIQDITPSNHVFFSSHVIEHVPSINDMLNHAVHLTRDDDQVYFISYCPNGSLERMNVDSNNYNKNWGLVHPNYISAEFYAHVFFDCPYFIDSFPFSIELLKAWDKNSQVFGKLEGSELLCIARIKKKLVAPF